MSLRIVIAGFHLFVFGTGSIIPTFRTRVFLYWYLFNIVVQCVYIFFLHVIFKRFLIHQTNRIFFQFLTHVLPVFFFTYTNVASRVSVFFSI